MTKLIYMTGDLFTSDAPALAQGVNTKGAMSSGIAVQFKTRYPEMHTEYRKQCADGTLEPGGVLGWIPEEGPTIYNVASQKYPGANAKIEWLSASMFSALHDAEIRGYDRIAIPKIGAGVGGLNWQEVEAYLRGLANESSVDIEIWSQDGWPTLGEIMGEDAPRD
jgi:O-acetyl-ADP-ribose deacetylase (regulator of RNase III)